MDISRVVIGKTYKSKRAVSRYNLALLHFKYSNMNLKEVIELERRISELKSRLDEAYKVQYRYKVYSQDDYHSAISRFTTNEDWDLGVQELGDIRHTETVFAINSEYSEYDNGYTSLKSNSLVDAIEVAAKNYLKVFSINDIPYHINPNVTKVYSFIRKNADKIRNHSESMKLQDLLATCNETNLELVKQLLEYTF